MYRNEKSGPKRGVALYSYSAEFGFEKDLEECFEDVHDMGAHGIEILANIHIENYPIPPRSGWTNGLPCWINTNWSRWNTAIG